MQTTNIEPRFIIIALDFNFAGLLAAEADKGEGLRMLVARAAGNVAKTIPKKLPAADAAQARDAFATLECHY